MLQFAVLAAARVTVLELVERRLDFVRRHVPDAESVAALDPSRRFDCVFDTTGNAASMERAFDYVASGGRLVFVGLVPGDVVLHDPEFHRREITLLASRNAAADDFTRVIEEVKKGRPSRSGGSRTGSDSKTCRAGSAASRATPHWSKAVVKVA